MLYQFLFKHLISRIDPEKIHHGAIDAIGMMGRCPLGNTFLRSTWGRSIGKVSGPWVGDKNGFKALARAVPGRLGLAAGMDKDAEAIEGLAALGFAFIEVGTFTAQPQPGNDKPRLFRIAKKRLIRNRMGFNNEGAVVAGKRLKKLRKKASGRALIVGANIGKTKVTPLDQAVADYVFSAQQVARWVDYLVVNVSSPNTPGLRDLQNVAALRPILSAVKAKAQEVSGRDLPLLVKIAPDLADADILAIADLVSELSLAGVVATNTTIQHDYGPGGLSGPVLTERAREVVTLLRRHLGPDPLIIGVGGITSVADAVAMLRAGADLLQGLTALIYEGPTWPGRINRRLAALGY